jgi:hypothetical protein
MQIYNNRRTQKVHSAEDSTKHINSKNNKKSESRENLKMFSSRFNTMSCKLEWDILDENYDYYQELARAGFADMLHDTDRVN